MLHQFLQRELANRSGILIVCNPHLNVLRIGREKILKILCIHPESSRNCFGFIIQNIIFFLSENAICCSGARDAVIITILGRALPDAINRCCAVIRHFTSWAMCITSIRSGAKAVGENHLPRPGRFVIDLIQRHRITRFFQGELIVLQITGTICTSNYDIFAVLRDFVAMIYAESNFRRIVVPIRHHQNIVALLRKRLSEPVIIYRNTITGQRNSRNVGVSTTRGSRGLILLPVFYSGDVGCVRFITNNDHRHISLNLLSGDSIRTSRSSKRKYGFAVLYVGTLGIDRRATQ